MALVRRRAGRLDGLRMVVVAAGPADPVPGRGRGATARVRGRWSHHAGGSRAGGPCLVRPEDGGVARGSACLTGTYSCHGLSRWFDGGSDGSGPSDGPTV